MIEKFKKYTQAQETWDRFLVSSLTKANSALHLWQNLSLAKVSNMQSILTSQRIIRNNNSKTTLKNRFSKARKKRRVRNQNSLKRTLNPLKRRKSKNLWFLLLFNKIDHKTTQVKFLTVWIYYNKYKIIIMTRKLKSTQLQTISLLIEFQFCGASLCTTTSTILSNTLKTLFNKLIKN